MRFTVKPALGALLVAQLLTACGGGGDASTETATASTPAATPAASSAFTRSASWTFTLPATGSSICYDIDADIASADCTGTAWDLKVTSGARGTTLWTNSGTSGTGSGGAFGGPFDHAWTALAALNSATTDSAGLAWPAAVYTADTARTVFTGTNGIGSAIFEYGLGGSSDHLLYPTYRTFLITSNATLADPVGTAASPVYALQVVGYYGGTSGVSSGHPTIRWVDRANPAAVRELTFDASAGWVYVDLGTGAVASQTGTWHIAFNRYNVKLNGGASGSGTVAGFVGRTPTGFYDSDDQAIAATVMAATPASTLADLTAADLTVPATASAWVSDALASALNPTPQMTSTAYDYGWYVYDPTTHRLTARADRGTLIRSGEGRSYARFHLTAIGYADASSPTSAQTWTFAFDIQPATAP
jgi:hypothetical protein